MGIMAAAAPKGKSFHPNSGVRGVFGKTNYRLFVSKTFCSQERKVPIGNVPGGPFVPGNFRSSDFSFLGTSVTCSLLLTCYLLMLDFSCSYLPTCQEVVQSVLE